MLLENNNFEFGEFFLDLKEKALLRDGKQLSITPKAFDLLVVLVENHNHLIEKDRLMQAVWADSFVEEGNLAFTIGMLRKALGDDSHKPRFIETVPKRGYRFIADVRPVECENKFSADVFRKEKLAESPDSSKRHFAVERIGNVFAVADSQSETRENFVEETPAQTDPHLVAPGRRILFGRAREISKTENLLCGEGVRLVTLTGAGGSGKTSVARFVAGNCLPQFADGIYFVELAPIYNPDLLVGAIAQALDVKESGGDSLFESLKVFLRERGILLVLDNFEQIISAAPVVSEILAATSAHLKILITSRAALRLSAENELVIPPLEIPPSDFSAISPEKLKNFSSVQMFAERARAAKPNFVLSDENVSAVAEICARLDGLPLAIELAAARAKLLKPAEILQRLGSRLEILTARSGDVPARQKTMRDTIAWSFGLLDEREKTLFRRLAVFAGGFTVKAAEAICGQDGEDAKVLDDLETLLANHLLQQTETHGETRLLPLETIREFAAEKLTADAREHAAMRRRHAEFLLNFARTAEYNIFGEKQTATLDLLEAERDNFRAALDWSRKTDDEIYLKLAAALAPLWTFRGYLSEGIECLTDALEKNPSAAAVRVKALTSLGQLFWFGSDYVRAIHVCEEILPTARRLDYKIACARLLQTLGMSYWWQYSDERRASAALKESLQLSRELGYDMGVVIALVVLAAIHQTKDRVEPAAEMLRESAAVARRMNNPLALSLAFVNSGRLAVYRGELAQAKILCRKGLKFREEISDRWGLVQCLEPLAVIAVKQGDARRAAEMLGAIDVLLKTVGAQPPLIFRADHEHNVAAVRAALDEKEFAEAFAAGRKLSVKEVVSLALDESGNQIDDAEFTETDALFSDYKSQAAVTTAKPLNVFSLPIKRLKPLPAFGLIGLFVGAVCLGFYFYTKNASSAGANKSIAVLPFKPINTANRDELYEIGIADSLIQRLGSMKGVIVRPLNATRKYANIEQDPLAAGREQQVDYVLASNYQLANGKIRVTAQLFNVSTGEIEETYKSEKDAGDVFVLQDAIAIDIANRLTARFAAQNSSSAKQGTRNEEAYRLYLQGRNLTERQTAADARKAIEYFEQAARLDPNFANAYAGMARAYILSSALGGELPRVENEKAKEAVKKALELDEDLAEAYAVRGNLKVVYEWNFAGAEKDLLRALEMEPNNDSARSMYALLLAYNGRFDEALTEIDKALAINPGSLAHQRDRARFLYYARRYDEAIVQLKRVVELDENFGTAWGQLWLAYEMNGDDAAAYETFIKRQKRTNPDRLGIYQQAHETAGWQGVRRKLLEFDKLDEQKPGSNLFAMARQCALLGEKEQSFEYLNKAVEKRQWQVPILNVEPTFDSLRDDPRFDELVKRVGLK